MIESPCSSPRFPTLTQQLYQLASGAVTSDELVRRSLRAIVASQSTLNCIPRGADPAGARRRRRRRPQTRGRGTTSAARHPDRGQGRRRRRGRSHEFRRSGQHPARHRRFRGRAPAARGRRGHRRQDEHLRVGSVAVHQRTGLRPHLQPVVTQAHPGRVVGWQRSGGGRRAGDRGDRLRRRGQRPDSRGVDAPGRHQAAARAHLHLAAARGVQRHHGQRRAGAHGHRCGAGAGRRIGKCRRRSAQAAAGAGVGVCRPRTRAAENRDVDQVPDERCSGPSCIRRSAPR